MATAASLGVPTIAPFKPKGEPTSVAQRWEKWIKSFNYFVDATGIENENRKKALLLHLAAAETQEIFDTLAPAEDTFAAPFTALNTHFAVTKNVPYERSKLNQARQEPSESIDQFITRLRKLALTCEYGNNTEDQIRDRVIASCNSSKLRTKLLSESNLTLNRVSEIGRTMETAKHNTKSIEEHNQTGHDHEPINRIQQQNYRGRGRNYRGRTPNRGGQQHYTNRSSTPRNNNQNRSQYQNQQPSNTCGRCGAKGHKTFECRRSKNATCSKCNIKGHFTNMCRTKTSKSTQPKGQGHIRHIQQIENQSDSDQSNENTDDEDIYVFNITV